VKPLLLNPDVADLAPDGDELTVYDEEHAVTYVRMLDAEPVRANWREVARISCILIRKRKPIAPAELSTANSRGQNGFPEQAIDSFCAGARYADLGELVGKSKSTTH